MAKKKICLAALLGIAIAGVACAQKSKVSDPKPFYEIRKGCTITFRLLEHTGGGYMWQWANQQQATIVDTVSVMIQSTSTDSRKIGAPTYSIWTFKGIKRGVDTLRFEELRVFQKNSTINTKEIVVRVR